MKEEPPKKLTIDRIATTEILYTPYGYIITEDGTVYSLFKQWYHGILLTLLFPEKAKEKGFEPPDEENANPYVYQKFEIDCHRELNVVRVCPTRFTGVPSINKGAKPATDAQMASLRKVIKVLGWKAKDIVNTDLNDCTVQECYEMLKEDHSE